MGRHRNDLDSSSRAFVRKFCLLDSGLQCCLNLSLGLRKPSQRSARQSDGFCFSAEFGRWSSQAQKRSFMSLRLAPLHLGQISCEPPLLSCYVGGWRFPVLKPVHDVTHSGLFYLPCELFLLLCCLVELFHFVENPKYVQLG